ncbi:MAG TPA: S8 family serine peptidase [Micromonosporaceae bacterium]|nr:S8 family serine peptidase [Micromonosporaceae bacterium]
MNLLPHTPWRAARALGGVSIATTVLLLLASSPAMAAPEGAILGADSPRAVAGSYLVVFKDGAMPPSSVGERAANLARQHGGSVEATFNSALRGFSAKMSAQGARRLAANPAVAYVQQDEIFTIADTQTNPPSWGLDRIDQRNLPLNNAYTYPNTAANVRAYIIDTGVRITHSTFGGRASHGRDTVSEDNDSTDCHGHGTHVAGTVGGSQYGVAKGVQIVGVRVLNCSGSGTTTDIVQGVDWVTANAVKPAVANMSLGGGGNTAIDNAVANSIASGITYAIAAGNSNANACNFSPARVPAAITVGATTSSDARASFSNFGSCLDIFAPGQSITSAWYTSNTATNTISGTSMAAPHVAGVAALILSANPTWSPAQVRDKMVADATTGVVGNAGSGSPNRLLFVDNGGSTPPPGSTVFTDDFEANRGWVTNPNGTDTATTGQWERGNPAGTSNGGVTLQLNNTTSGSNGLVTGAAAGTDAGSFDVDGGVTTIQSPAITLPSSGTLTLTFNWYLAHLNNSSSADFFRCVVVAGSTSTVFQQLGAATNRAGSWSTATVNLSSFAGQTIRLRFEAADASTASLVEAGVDDVRIVQS